MKLEIRSVGPPLPETIGLLTGFGLCIFVMQCIEYRYSGWVLALIESSESHCANMVVCIQCIDYVADLLVRRGQYRIVDYRGM